MRNLIYAPTPAAVKRGMAYLDRVKPGWFRQVNTDTLALSSCTRCVLGQLYGHYSQGLVECGFPELQQFDAPDKGNEWAKRHGFNAHSDSDYGWLTQRWREAILLRRAAQPHGA